MGRAMAFVVSAISALVVSAFASTAAIGVIGIGGAAAIGTAIGTAVVVGGAALAANALTPTPTGDRQKFNPSASASSFIAEDEGRKLTVRQAVPMRRFIYGRALVSGPMFFFENANPFVYMGIILADGPIDSIEEVRIAGKVVSFDANGDATTFPYRDGSNVYLHMSFRNGADDQPIDPLLAADYAALPSTFRQRGVATIVLKFHYGTDRDHHEVLWPSGDISPKFLIKGQKVYDPRDAGQSASDKTTWKWSDNPSLCVSHYLTNKWRRPVDIAKIDTDTLKIEADIDDEMVGLLSGGLERRYTANGVISSDKSDFTAVRNVLTASNGRVVLRRGKYSIKSSAKIATSPLTISDGDIKGPVAARHATPEANLLNKLRTRFSAPDREWQVADGPIVEVAAYVTADGKTNDSTVELPFTNSASRAQRLARQVIETERRGKQIVTTLGDIGQLMEADDVYRVETTTLTRLNGLWRVEQTEQSDGGIGVVLKEYDDAIYAWDPASDEQEFTISPVSL